MSRTEWRLLLDAPADGAANMARDEALLRSAAQGTPPTLRFYTWKQPTLSLGAHQDAGDADLAACRARGVDLVRRPTGGGAVLHAEEMTYAVASRLGEGVLPRSVIGVYERISEALVRGLAHLGVDARAARPAGSARAPASCFDLPSAREILADGRKLVGSAQVRRRGTCLQHGSLLIDFDAERLAAVLPGARAGLSSARAACPNPSGGPSGTTAAPATLRELCGRIPPREEIEAALIAGFEEALEITLVPGTYTSDESVDAHRLRASKYFDAVWTLEGRVRSFGADAQVHGR